MADFLNKYCELHRNPSDQELLSLKTKFLDTVNKVQKVLGNKAFRTFDAAKKSPKFNAALYDAQMITFSELDLLDNDIQHLIDNNIVERNYEFISSEPFVIYISRATTDNNYVTGRINGYKQFIQSILP